MGQRNLQFFFHKRKNVERGDYRNKISLVNKLPRMCGLVNYKNRPESAVTVIQCGFGVPMLSSCCS